MMSSLSFCAGQQCGSPQLPLSLWLAGTRSGVCFRLRSLLNWDKLCLVQSCWPLTTGTPPLICVFDFMLAWLHNHMTPLMGACFLLVWRTISLWTASGTAMISTWQSQSTNQASDPETSSTSRIHSSGHCVSFSLLILELISSWSTWSQRTKSTGVFFFIIICFSF